MYKSLEVVTAAVETKLTTLDRLKTDLSLTQETDAFLNSVIDLASAEISAYLNQGADDEAKASIARQTVKEVLYGATGHRLIYLSRFPIGEITSIQENTSLVARQITGADAVMTALDNTLTAAGASFSETLAGKAITVTGAGAAGADLVTTVASRTSDTELELTDAAGTTVSSAAYAIDNPAFLYRVNKGHGTIAKYMGNSLAPP